MYNKKNFLILFSIIIFVTYIIGFIINENSIGSGNYSGDLNWIWKNFDIFKNKNIFSAISSEDFFGNRTPLLYLLNIYLNPFLHSIDSYRLSIFIFSFLGPLAFFLCIKKKYDGLKIELILFLSLIILLSPFYRTSAYWGLEIQYGIISALLSFYFFLKIQQLKIYRTQIFFLRYCLAQQQFILILN